MSVWANLESRLRRIARAVLQSEEHLESIARSGESLARSAQAPQAPQAPLPSPEAARIASQLEGTQNHLGFIAGMMARREMVELLSAPRYADPLRLERSGFRCHSQYDEDGIIAEIFRRIGTESRVFVEFGSGRGDQNCTILLLMQGWKGLWIEGDPSLIFFIEHIWRNEIRAGLLTVRNAMITPDSVNDIIESAGFSGEIDFLSVDVDGNDYHLLDKISAIAPRVICAEYNAWIPPEISWVMERNDAYVWDNIDSRTGASLKALETLLRKRGYALVGCSPAGVNAFFVRADLAQGRFAEPFTAENHYHPWRFFHTGVGSQGNWRGWRA